MSSSGMTAGHELGDLVTPTFFARTTLAHSIHFLAVRLPIQAKQEFSDHVFSPMSKMWNAHRSIISTRRRGDVYWLWRAI
jgi:hypothetical protein